MMSLKCKGIAYTKFCQNQIIIFNYFQNKDFIMQFCLLAIQLDGINICFHRGAAPTNFIYIANIVYINYC